jgi:hypothetical protein
VKPGLLVFVNFQDPDTEIICQVGRAIAEHKALSSKQEFSGCTVTAALTNTLLGLSLSVYQLLKRAPRALIHELGRLERRVLHKPKFLCFSSLIHASVDSKHAIDSANAIWLLKRYYCKRYEDASYIV